MGGKSAEVPMLSVPLVAPFEAAAKLVPEGVPAEVFGLDDEPQPPTSTALEAAATIASSRVGVLQVIWPTDFLVLKADIHVRGDRVGSAA